MGYNFKIGDYSGVITTTSTGMSANIDISLPVGILPNIDAKYLVTCQNPSTGSAVTVIVQNKHTSFGASSSTSFCELTRFSVGSSGFKDVVVQGMFIGSGSARLTFSNDSTTSSTALTNYFRITKI